MSKIGCKALDVKIGYTMMIVKVLNQDGDQQFVALRGANQDTSESSKKFMDNFGKFVNGGDSFCKIIDILPDKILSESVGNTKRAYLMVQPTSDTKLPQLDLTINSEKKVK